MFQFAHEVVERDFESTFDAYCDIITAYNMYEDYFVGAKIDNTWVKILDAESHVTRFVEYLHAASCYGLSDKQILEETKEHFNESCSKVPSSWKQIMKDYSKTLSQHTEKITDKVYTKPNQNK